MGTVSQLPPIKGNRCCGNCGCYVLMAGQNPLERQGFCTKDPPQYVKVRVLVPRVNPRTKEVDVDRTTGKQIGRAHV